MGGGSGGARQPVWCDGDEWCAVFAATRIFGRKWHMAIMHRLIRQGELRFSELKQAVGAGISDKMLSESLKDLQKKGLVNRRIVQEQPVRVAYQTTERGAPLEPVVDAVAEWGETYLEPAASKDESIV